MSRISKSAVNQALEQAAKRLVDAGGADKKISRADVKKALSGLEGPEKQLVDAFFDFVDKRDARPGSVVTAKDVQLATEYAKKHLLEKYDLNGNGYSASEIERMSRTGRLAVELARELKKTPKDPAPNPSGPALTEGGESFYELRQRVTITSEKRVTSAKGIDETLKAQLIAATHQSTYTHVRTLQDAFEAVDGGEFVIRQLTDPASGRKYTAIDYGAGDSTYGAIFEAGSTRVAVSIQDGDLLPQ